MFGGRIGLALPNKRTHVDPSGGACLGKLGVDDLLPLRPPSLHVRCAGLLAVEFSAFLADPPGVIHAPGSDDQMQMDVTTIAVVGRSVDAPQNRATVPSP